MGALAQRAPALGAPNRLLVTSRFETPLVGGWWTASGGNNTAVRTASPAPSGSQWALVMTRTVSVGPIVIASSSGAAASELDPNADGAFSYFDLLHFNATPVNYFASIRFFDAARASLGTFAGPAVSVGLMRKRVYSGRIEIPPLAVYYAGVIQSQSIGVGQFSVLYKAQIANRPFNVWRPGPVQ